MKKYTHAWLAFMAIKRLEDKKDKFSAADRKYAENLIDWFKGHKDNVVEGAWYPDKLIKKNDDQHVLKFVPDEKSPPDKDSILPEKRRKLPKDYLIAELVKVSPVRQMAFKVADPNDNLPDRCESLTEAVVDQLKVQQDQDKGSPVAPMDNQIALWFFMLSHYIADAHVPLHCDSRSFPEKGDDIHAAMEKVWEKEIEDYYRIDTINERFLHDPGGYPALKNDAKMIAAYPGSILKAVNDNLAQREFNSTFGAGNDNVWDFIDAVCHNSYLLSYRFFPPDLKFENVNKANWQGFSQPVLSVKELGTAVLSDAVDSIARVWFRAFRRYDKWSKKPEKAVAGEDE